MDSRSRLDSRWSARHRAPTKGEGRRPATPGAHLGTLRACAPPPLRPPGLRPRVRAAGFSRHWSLGGGAGSAPWADRGDAGRGTGALRLWDAWSGAGRVTCLTESRENKKKKTPWNPHGGDSCAHAYSDWLGAAAENAAAVAERRKSLTGRGGAGWLRRRIQVVSGSLLGVSAKPQKSRLCLGREKGSLRFLSFLFFFLSRGTFRNLESSVVRIQTKLINDRKASFKNQGSRVVPVSPARICRDGPAQTPLPAPLQSGGDCKLVGGELYVRVPVSPAPPPRTPPVVLSGSTRAAARNSWPGPVSRSPGPPRPPRALAPAGEMSAAAKRRAEALGPEWSRPGPVGQSPTPGARPSWASLSRSPCGHT